MTEATRGRDMHPTRVAKEERGEKRERMTIYDRAATRARVRDIQHE